MMLALKWRLSVSTLVKKNSSPAHWKGLDTDTSVIMCTPLAQRCCFLNNGFCFVTPKKELGLVKKVTLGLQKVHGAWKQMNVGLNMLGGQSFRWRNSDRMNVGKFSYSKEWWCQWILTYWIKANQLIYNRRPRENNCQFVNAEKSLFCNSQCGDWFRMLELISG